MKRLLLFFLFLMLIINSLTVLNVRSEGQDFYREYFYTDFRDSNPYSMNYTSDDFNVSLLNETGYMDDFDTGFFFDNTSNIHEGKHLLYDNDEGHVLIDYLNKGLLTQFEISGELQKGSTTKYFSFKLNNTDGDCIYWFRIQDVGSYFKVHIGEKVDENPQLEQAVFPENYVTDNDSNHNFSLEVRLINNQWWETVVQIGTLSSINQTRFLKNTGGNYPQNHFVDYGFLWGGQLDFRNKIKSIAYVASDSFYYESIYDESGDIWDLGSYGDSDPSKTWSRLNGATIVSREIRQDMSNTDGCIIPCSMPGFSGLIKTFRMLVKIDVDDNMAIQQIAFKNKFILNINALGSSSRWITPSIMVPMNKHSNKWVYLLAWEDIDMRIDANDLPTLGLQFNLHIHNYNRVVYALTTPDRPNNIDDFRLDRLVQVWWRIPFTHFTQNNQWQQGVLAYYGWDTDGGDYVPPPPPSEITISVNLLSDRNIQYNDDVQVSTIVTGTYKTSWWCFWNITGNKILQDTWGTYLKGKLRLGSQLHQYKALKQYGSGDFGYRVVIQDVSSIDNVDFTQYHVQKTWNVNNTDTVKPDGSERFVVSNYKNNYVYPLKSYAYAEVKRSGNHGYYLLVKHIQTNEYMSFNFSIDDGELGPVRPHSYYAIKPGWYQWEVYAHGNGTYDDHAMFYVFQNTESDQNYIKTGKSNYNIQTTIPIEYGHTVFQSDLDIKLEVKNLDSGNTKQFMLSSTGNGIIDYIPQERGTHECYFVYNDTLQISFPIHTFQVSEYGDNTVLDYAASTYGGLIGISLVFILSFFAWYATKSPLAFTSSFMFMTIFFSLPNSPIRFFDVTIGIFAGLILVSVIAFMFFIKR